MTDKKRITIYVSDREYKMIYDLAEKKCTSMSKVLIGTVIYYLNHLDHEGYDYNFRWRGWFRKR